MADGEWTGPARAGDPVALTRLLVSIPSVNPTLSSEGQGEEEISSVCASLLREWGFETTRTEVSQGRWNVVARIGSGSGSTLLLNGHLDTVGIEGMEIDPFEPAQEEGRIYGRGSCDMKAGVATILGVAAALRDTPPAGELVVALTCDEEHASLGMQALVGEGVRADGAVVCEPTELAIMPAHKGFVWIDVTWHGVAAHGSRPEIGVDAVRLAGAYLSQIESIHGALAAGARHPLLGPASFHIGTIEGGTAPSVYPEQCVVTIERRTLPGERLDDVVAPFRTAVEAVEVPASCRPPKFEVTLERAATEVPGGDPVIVGLGRALGQHDLPERIEGMTAWVDAAFLNEAGIPAVCFGPGSIGQAHSAREWVDVEQIRCATDVLETFTRHFLGLE